MEGVAADWRECGPTLLGMDTAALDYCGSLGTVGAFQVAQITLLIGQKQGYIDVTGRVSNTEFVRILNERLSDGKESSTEWKKAVGRYLTAGEDKPMRQQVEQFAEDVAMVLSGSLAAGMILSVPLVPVATEFLFRNRGLAADFFDDKATLLAMAKAVQSLHDLNDDAKKKWPV